MYKYTNNMIWGLIKQRWDRYVSIFKSLELSLVLMSNENDDGNRLFNAENNIIFYLPDSLEPEYIFNGLYSYYEDINLPILPLLWCLKIPNTMKLLMVLLSEQNVSLVSKNITIFSSCVRVTAAILVQGLLIWRHIQIPILPPHLLK